VAIYNIRNGKWYNSFTGAASVNGDGDSHYYGIGLLGRLDRVNNTYIEGSIRAGRVNNKLKETDLIHAGTKATFKSRANYHGKKRPHKSAQPVK
jgi:hypothetical protein